MFHQTLPFTGGYPLNLQCSVSSPRTGINTDHYEYSPQLRNGCYPLTRTGFALLHISIVVAGSRSLDRHNHGVSSSKRDLLPMGHSTVPL
jgi:hypothetical protein